MELLMIRFFIDRYRTVLLAVLLATACAGVGLFFLSDYLLSDFNSLMGVVLLPYLVIARDNTRFPRFYLFPAAVLLLLSFLAPMKALYYYSLVCTLLLLGNAILGRLNHLPLFLFVVISPMFRYLSNVFGIPIRFQLSKAAAALLSMAGWKAEATGNLIVLNGFEFSVDPACMGLNMLTTSLVIGLFALAWYERKTGKQLSFARTLFALLVIVGLNIGCNLVRIVFVVFFHILPDTPMHSLAGLACLVLYVIAPMFVIVRLLYRFAPVAAGKEKQTPEMNITRLFLPLLLVAGLLVRGLYLPQDVSAQHQSIAAIQIAGFQKKQLSSGVLKFVRDHALIYIKPAVGFYGADHSPMVCWMGSGYEFRNINKTSISGNEVYTGILEKGTDRLYTAWWFDNGRFRTISQWEWRTRMVRGEAPFHMVNVSADTEVGLKEEVARWMKGKVL